MIIIKILMSIIILLAAPCMIGGLFVHPDADPAPGVLIPAGLFAELLVFELVCTPVVLFTRGENFRLLLMIYTPVLIAMCALGVLRCVKYGIYGKLRSGISLYRENTDAQILVFRIIAIALLIVILVLMETRVLFDGDDAYYVSQSVAAWQNGAMYSVNPYNGRAAAIDLRHAMATFTMWIAYVSKVTGVHPAIMAHTVLPLVLVPTALLILTETGALLFDKRKELVPVFVIFAEIMIIFGRVSIYTAESFLTARIWQGKAMAACILIPAAFLAFALMGEGTAESGDPGIKESGSRYREAFPWLFLALIDAVAGIFSSLAVELISVLIFTGGAIIAFRDRRLKTLAATAACCIPGMIYMLIYLYFAFITWR